MVILNDVSFEMLRQHSKSDLRKLEIDHERINRNLPSIKELKQHGELYSSDTFLYYTLNGHYYCIDDYHFKKPTVVLMETALECEYRKTWHKYFNCGVPAH